MPKSTEKFFLGHSLASNRAPKGVSLKDLLDKVEQPQVDLETFGFFEVSAPDFNKFYPNLKPEDLVPQDEDFAYPLFRALSETRVNKWGPINFSKNNVIKAAVKKLIGQAVYTNHEMVVGNEVGVVKEAEFQKPFKQDGIDVPGGINVRLKLDGKANPKLVRSIMSDPPSVHSVSVTVEFEWVQSHPQLTSTDFWAKVGSFDDKGNLIERVVTNIVSFHEISLVPHGADPYAQKITEDGGLNNPDYARRADRYHFSKEEFSTLTHHMDWKDFKENIASFSTIPPDLNNQNNDNQNNSKPMNEQLLAFLRAQLGLAKDAPESEVVAKLQARLPELVIAEGTLKTTNDSFTALKAKYPEGAEVLSTEQKASLASYDKALTAERLEAVRLYKLTTDKPSDAIVDLISKGNYETVAAMKEQYAKTAEEKFEASCSDCGSKNVSRASASQEDPNGDGKGKGQKDGEAFKTPKSNADVVAQFSKQSNSAHSIHGQD